MEPPTLIYLGDPMCSWCWGFAPVLERLSTDHPIEVMVGGLRPGPAAEVLSPRLEDFLRNEWSQIAARTDQPFDTGFLDDLGPDWIYDTELGAIAVTRMRELKPERTLEFFARIQRAFYAERVDVTRPEVFGPLAVEFDLDPGEFVDSLGTDAARKVAWADFAQARRWGVTGFPSLVARHNDRLHLLAAGYRPYEEIAAALTTFG